MLRLALRLGMVLLACLSLCSVYAGPIAHADSPALSRFGVPIRSVPVLPDTTGTISADVLLVTTDTGANQSFPVHGWLVLAQKGGTSVAYTGYLIDNSSGGKKYPAQFVADGSSTPNAGTYILNTHLGRFVFALNADSTFTTVSVPTRMGKSSVAGFQIVPHLYTTTALNVKIDGSYNGYYTPSKGTLTLTTSATNDIAPYYPAMGAISNFGYVARNKPAMTPILNGGLFLSPTDPSGGFLNVQFKLNSAVFSIWSRGSSGQFFTVAWVGTGINTVEVNFTATP